ncbi:TolC family protein [Tellurirhabdus bombi]|uniref:TolC family protein n=1 Tax=Tellurirhabdus bombi TaxID=2907205 RepID=UPI001F376214|nr:TolC family protein [Tellurirhabdus bombi]
MKRIFYLAALVISALPLSTFAQAVPDSVLQQATLDNCIQYALKNQPVIRQSVIDEAIADRTVKSRLSAWYPQIGGAYNLQHYLQLPVTILPDFTNPNSDVRRAVTTGVPNTSSVQFSFSQNIFNRDVLLASRTGSLVRLQSGQVTTSNKIDLVVNVSKAYYDVLLTQKQVEILNSNIVRLQRSLQDATNQYKSGIVDKTDYQRATIALNTTRAQHKQYVEQVGSKYEYLKQLMNYPISQKLPLEFDTLQLAREVAFDTLQGLNLENRIEYQQLQTQRQLLQANVRYNRWAYLPSLSAFGNYNLVFQNTEFTKLYSQRFPNSLIGVTLALPIFQGGRRVQEVRIAELQLQRSQWDVTALKNGVNSEYAQALANYKGNLANLNALQENVELAQDVYRIISLQYRSGVKAYLDVVISESDLRAAQLSHLNALYQTLSSKLDVQRALGTIQF